MGDGANELAGVREQMRRLEAVRRDQGGFTVEQATLYRVLVARDAELLLEEDGEG